MNATENDSIRQQVRDAYGAIAREGGCVAGAVEIDTLTSLLEAAGFEAIRLSPKSASAEYIRHWAPGRRIEQYIASANIEAVKKTCSHYVA